MRSLFDVTDALCHATIASQPQPAVAARLHLHCQFTDSAPFPDTSRSGRTRIPLGNPQSAYHAGPMHQALQIVDILHLVFQQLASDEDTPWNVLKVNQRALSRASRVCKIFESPALDALWAYMEDIRNLLRLLPPLKNSRQWTYVSILGSRVTSF